MARRNAKRTAPSLLIVLAVTLLLGIARIALAVADDFAGPGPHQSATADSLTIRRTIKLVAFSVEALATQFGLAAADDSQMRGGPSAVRAEHDPD